MNKDEYTQPSEEALAEAREETREMLEQRIKGNSRDAFELEQGQADAMRKNMDEVDELKLLQQKVDELDQTLADHINGITDWTHEVAGRFDGQESARDQLLSFVNDLEARVNRIPVTPDLIQQALTDANDSDDSDKARAEETDSLIEAIDRFILERNLNFVPIPYEAGDYPTILVHAALRQTERALIEYHQSMPPSMGDLIPIGRMLTIVRNAMPGDDES